MSSAGIAQTEKDLGVAVRRHPNTHDAPYVDQFHPVLVFTANEYFVLPTEGVPYLFNEPYLHLVHRLLRAYVDECSSLVLSSEGWAKRCIVRGVISVDVGYNSVCGQAWVQRDLCSDPGILKHNADLDSRVRKMLGRLAVASSGVLEDSLRSKHPGMPNIWRGGRGDTYSNSTVELQDWFLLDELERPLNRCVSATTVFHSSVRLCDFHRNDKGKGKKKNFCARHGCCGPDGDLIALLRSDSFAAVAPPEAISALREECRTGKTVPILWANGGPTSTKELSCHRDKSNGRAEDDAYLSALHGVIEFDSLSLTTKIFLTFHGHRGPFFHASFLSYGREFLTNRVDAMENKVLSGTAKYIMDRLTNKVLEIATESSNDYDYTEFVQDQERFQAYAKSNMRDGELGYGDTEDYNGPYILRRACANPIALITSALDCIYHLSHKYSLTADAEWDLAYVLTVEVNGVSRGADAVNWFFEDDASFIRQYLPSEYKKVPVHQLLRKRNFSLRKALTICLRKHARKSTHDHSAGRSAHCRVVWSHKLSSTSDTPLKDPHDPLDPHLKEIEDAKRITFEDPTFQLAAMSHVADKDIRSHYLRYKTAIGTKCYGLTPTGIGTSIFVKALCCLGLAEPRFMNESFVATGSGAHEFFQSQYGDEEWFDKSNECLQKCLYDTTYDMQLIDASITASYVEMCACEMQKGTVTHGTGKSQRMIRPDVFLCKRIDDDTVRSPLFFRTHTGKVPSFHPSKKTTIIVVFHQNDWRRVDELMTTPFFSSGFGLHYVREQPWKLKMALNPNAPKWISKAGLDKKGSEFASDVVIQFPRQNPSEKRKRP